MTTHAEQDNLLRETEGGEYRQKYDSHRPRFKGLPEGFYPNTWANVVLIWVLVFVVYAICAGIFALFLYLLLLNPPTVTWIFFGCFIGYAFLILVLILYGTMNRRKLEKEYIEKALAQYNKDEADANAQSNRT